ncbi:unnamed protein product [Brachionus calyciflorus]|uniref:TIR domain-containing protein n=1 Tax=Brachionus calyciflorus TaxID=104777 RepID=A0A813U7G2_9BILA|nr:unnamed protein product [Brachionus calyciflorus]
MEASKYDFNNITDDTNQKATKAIEILSTLKLNQIIGNSNALEALDFLSENEVDYEIFCEKNFGVFFSEIMVDLFKVLITFNCKESETDLKNSPYQTIESLLLILKSCLLIVNLACLNSVNFTKDFSSFNNGLEAHFIFFKEQDFLFEIFDKTQINNEPSYFIELIFLNIYMFSKNSEEISNKWIELDAVNILINIAKTRPSLELDAFLIITNIVTDKQIENLTEIHGIVEHIQKKIELASKSFQEKKFDRVTRQIIDDDQILNVEVQCVRETNGSTSSLLVFFNGLYRLSVNDQLRSDIFYKNNFHSALKIVLLEGNEIEKKYTLKLYAQLAFNAKISNDLSNDQDLIEYFNSLLSNNSLGTLCEQILWNISQGTKNLEINKQDLQHIMISYNSLSRDLCLKIKSRLESNGYKVWMDVEHIHGSSLDSMAKAVENSFCVLICITEKYRQSINCQSEALYAFRLKKPIIPLILQKNYENVKGWLGFIIGDKIYVNFTKFDFDVCMKSLSDEIVMYSGEKKNYEAPVEVVEKEISIDKWDDLKCKEWFESNGLNMNIYNNLTLCNGIILHQLYEMRCDAPEFFYQMLKNFEGVDMNSILNFTYFLKKLF